MTIRRLAAAYGLGNSSFIYEMPIYHFPKGHYMYREQNIVTHIKIASFVKMSNGKKWGKIEKSKVIYQMPFEYYVKEIVNNYGNIIIVEDMVYNRKDLTTKHSYASISDEIDDY